MAYKVHVCNFMVSLRSDWASVFLVLRSVCLFLSAPCLDILIIKGTVECFQSVRLSVVCVSVCMREKKIVSQTQLVGYKPFFSFNLLLFLGV